MATARRHGLDLDLIYPRASRSTPHGHLESLYGLAITLDHGLDATVAEITDKPRDALAIGDVFGEEPKTDTLNLPSD